MTIRSASLKLKARISCFIRKKLVAATPEEMVRQSVIKEMVTHLSYPASLITLEKELRELIPLEPFQLKRRLDIVAFAKGKRGGLFPLIIIECKATSFSDKALSQVLGYNLFLAAPFFGVVSREMRALFTKENQKIAWIGDSIPPYEELIARL